jgi:hypothetical protein
MRLSGHIWFPVLDYEIMAGCILQNLEQDGGVGLPNSGNDYWRVSTKVN